MKHVFTKSLVKPCHNGYMVRAFCKRINKDIELVFSTLEDYTKWLQDNLEPVGEQDEFLDNLASEPTEAVHSAEWTQRMHAKLAASLSKNTGYITTNPCAEIPMAVCDTDSDSVPF